MTGLAHLKGSWSGSVSEGPGWRKLQWTHVVPCMSFAWSLSPCVTTCACVWPRPAKRSCVFIICVLCLRRKSKWVLLGLKWWMMNQLFTCPRILGWKLTYSENVSIILPYQCLECFYTQFMLQWVLIVHICAQGQNQRRIRWINIFKDLG